MKRQVIIKASSHNKRHNSSSQIHRQGLISRRGCQDREVGAGGEFRIHRGIRALLIGNHTESYRQQRGIAIQECLRSNNIPRNSMQVQGMRIRISHKLTLTLVSLSRVLLT
jgi:hypothetical protein